MDAIVTELERERVIQTEQMNWQQNLDLFLQGLAPHLQGASERQKILLLSAALNGTLDHVHPNLKRYLERHINPWPSVANLVTKNQMIVPMAHVIGRLVVTRPDIPAPIKPQQFELMLFYSLILQFLELSQTFPLLDPRLFMAARAAFYRSRTLYFRMGLNNQRQVILPAQELTLVRLPLLAAIPVSPVGVCPAFLQDPQRRAIFVTCLDAAAMSEIILNTVSELWIPYNQTLFPTGAVATRQQTIRDRQERRRARDLRLATATTTGRYFSLR